MLARPQERWKTRLRAPPDGQRAGLGNGGESACPGRGSGGTEQAATGRLKRREKQCRRTIKRHRTEVEALLDARQRCEEMRKQYIVLWEECRTRTETLLNDRQSLAGEALAVEQLRFEILGKSENAAATEKRLDKLRRQSQELIVRAEAERAAQDREACGRNSAVWRNAASRYGRTRPTSSPGAGTGEASENLGQAHDRGPYRRGATDSGDAAPPRPARAGCQAAPRTARKWNVWRG